MSVEAPRPKPIIPAEDAAIMAASSSLAKRKRRMKKKTAKDQRRGMKSRRNARGPVTHAEDAVAAHHLPVQQHRLLQPGRAVQRGDDPVMAGQHLAGNLGIARLIRAEQAKCAQSKKEKEKAHAQQPARAAQPAICCDQFMRMGIVHGQISMIRLYANGVNLYRAKLTSEAACAAAVRSRRVAAASWTGPSVENPPAHS